MSSDSESDDSDEQYPSSGSESDDSDAKEWYPIENKRKEDYMTAKLKRLFRNEKGVCGNSAWNRDGGFGTFCSIIGPQRPFQACF